MILSFPVFHQSTLSSNSPVFFFLLFKFSLKKLQTFYFATTKIAEWLAKSQKKNLIKRSKPLLSNSYKIQFHSLTVNICQVKGSRSTQMVKEVMNHEQKTRNFTEKVQIFDNHNINEKQQLKKFQVIKKRV